MDNKSREKYFFPETLSNQQRWFGLPLDEAIIYIPLALLAIFSSHLIFGLTLVASFATIRKLKRGKGSSYLLNLLYWFLPRSISNLFLWALPPSYYRYWIS
ncbi:type IV conjugative transfer system protein TraL [Ursidibacter arcticus]